MTAFFLWYLLITVIGLAAFPIVYLVLPGLPGRGYAFARAFGLLVWGYLYWMLGSLGILGNDSGGLILSALAVVGGSAYALTRIDLGEFSDWWRRNRGTVIVTEALFLIAFGAWTYVRAANPEIAGTEKPMELAFLNSVLRSPGFPPNDPWLSGYSISYYYFGYVLIGMLAMLTGTPGVIAFNLGISAVFALSAVSAYGVIDSLLKAAQYKEEGKPGPFWALFGPLYILLVSNLEGFLDLLHANGLFWTTLEDGTRVSRFWAWLNIKDLVNPPPAGASFPTIPDRYYWWWRASRVINDVSLGGTQIEVIDEFPFFSFLLSDLHPHVLSIPFVLLAVGFALHIYFRDGDSRLRIGRFAWRVAPLDFAVGALLLGSLAFLNTWDFPIYVAVFTGAYLLRTARTAGWSFQAVLSSLGLGALVAVAGVVLYFPFYIGFSSQAGGVLPNVIHPTSGAQLWVMFGSLFVPILLYLLFELRRGRPEWSRGLAIGFGVVLGIWTLSMLVVLGVGLLPETATAALERLGAASGSALLDAAFERRFAALGGLLTIALILSGALALGLRAGRPVAAFAGMLCVIGLLLVLGPEFFYLRDLFGSRMNTIFKFYYQAWMLLGLAAAYGTARLIYSWRGFAGGLAAAGILVVLLMALTYPVLSLNTKTNGFDPGGGLTLDGSLGSGYLTPDDRAAVAWLLDAPLGTLLEAVGGQYSSGGRIAVHTGQPNVLGWKGHENQWRGGYEEVGTREDDIAAIYQTRSWDEARALLDRYGVRYIYIGDLERSTYRVYEEKFARILPVLFQQGSVVIYGYSPAEP